ncbi:glycosyltransferase family 4 protein [Dietzia cinnamea]|uniref:glycosyltransferase family 4 protein n=1 Tax=Dietzia cinnamea TaxID=321318 RepID=UPI00195AF588|nr:glycosyltransferase family 1 protein [Dietzia cinnamea]MBM7231720.1 glycosyltransferase family 1 protein [Dietzia cinnamea]MCT2058266.1 glycosyltransferase family 1 protein [Dietzia cinnamea]MCT2120790.1 glycosyltransferase family 1 protein [Dietzia cinnamea]MCT2144975.1 glycosyltransferase family 1 protein [Dietzia cinnamea]MCT2303557.1 glycosyltransferase family 1 protein [Dietzia cinnamea]
MRVALVTESFLPNVNGVTNSVLRVLEYARRHGHDCLVVAPSDQVGFWQGAAGAVQAHPLVSAVSPYLGRPASDGADRDHHLGYPVHRVTAVRVPVVSSLPVGAPSPSVYNALRDFAPDVVHLASPFVLGAAGAAAARALGVPSVAVYQTDVAGFADAYGIGVLADAAWAWTRAIHATCDRTLAPSTAAMADLAARGIPRLYRWGRGVDSERFTPARRSAALHRLWSPEGRPVIGFVGRLAPEKHVERLQPLADRSGPDGDVRLVVVGDGPDRPALQAAMPHAIFTGELHGEALARAYATLDVFCHAGEFETFCQSIQEAHASGVPVIGPDAGGPRDLVQAGVNGVLLDPGRYAAEVSAALDAVLADRDRLAAAARATVAGRTWDAVCGQLFDHYVAAGARSSTGRVGSSAGRVRVGLGRAG